jgi:hypothetical protein
VHRSIRRPSGRPPGRHSDRRLARCLAASALLLGLFVSTGCGPFGYLKKVAKDASRAVAEAEAAGAEEYAPYEYWGSKAYLDQAKVLMGYSEYERSFDFAERAKQLANEAKVKAQRVKKGGSVIRDENIATPDQMIDSDGNQIDSIDEANKPEGSKG